MLLTKTKNNQTIEGIFVSIHMHSAHLFYDTTHNGHSLSPSPSLSLFLSLENPLYSTPAPYGGPQLLPVYIGTVTTGVWKHITMRIA